MKIFAISDLHISFYKSKPMDIFGSQWLDHHDKIANNWNKTVGEEDFVLLAGDISWAKKFEEATPDFEFIADLPGKKIIIRGNHDYWWTSIGKLRKKTLPNIFFIQNDALNFPLVSKKWQGITVGGTRLWNYPFVNWPKTTEKMEEQLNNSHSQKVIVDSRAQQTDVGKKQDEKIRQRELLRMEMSLQKMAVDNHLKIFLTHYPPLGEDGGRNQITSLLTKNQIDICLFGHLHGIDAPTEGFDYVRDEVRYLLTSCDHIGFCPKMIIDL